MCVRERERKKKERERQRETERERERERQRDGDCAYPINSYIEEICFRFSNKIFSIGPVIVH